MYLWFAIDVDQQLTQLRKKAEQITAAGRISNAALTLPAHISLRISFPVEEDIREELLAKVRHYFQSLAPFSVQIKGLEVVQGIVWLRIRENDRLQEIHTQLLDLTQREYAIAPHPFDGDFKYHVSLLTGNDPRLARDFFQALGQLPLPATLRVDTLILGASPTGRAGDYAVTETIFI